MLFQKRIERAFRHQAEQSAKGRTEGPDTPDGELKLSDIMEKGDLLAMIAAALITILPVALGVLLIMCLAGWLFVS